MGVPISNGEVRESSVTDTKRQKVMVVTILPGELLARGRQRTNGVLEYNRGGDLQPPALVTAGLLERCFIIT